MAKATPTRESVQALIGTRTSVLLMRPFQYEVKTTKFEPRTLLLTSYRLYLLSTKSPLKIELSFNLLELTGVESSALDKLLFLTDSKRIALQSASDENSVDDVVFLIFDLLWNTFPEVPLEKIITKVEMSPSSRWKDLLERLESTKRPSGLCGNFSSAHAFVCDRLSLPNQDDVAWDVDTIYHAHKITELFLCDFEYLEPRLYATIIASLRHNQYFSGLNLSGIKLSSECLQEVLDLMKVNSFLKDLSLSNTGIRHDFIQKLVAAFSANKALALTTLDLSCNVLEEKGVLNLCSAVSVIGRLTGLNLSGCSITAKALMRLIDTCLVHNKQLTSLDLSDNGLKDDLISLQNNILCQQNSLTSLKLSGTDCPVEVLMNAVNQGCRQTLVHLDLSKNPFKKSSRDSANVSLSWQQFFSSASAIQSVNLSSTKIHPEAVRHIFSGLTSNTKLSSLELNLSGNVFGQIGAAVLENVIPEVHNIASLDLSDNAFDQSLSNVALAFAKSSGYQNIALGKNLGSSKIKNVVKILDNVAQLLQVENMTIEGLALDEMKLRSDSTVILNVLGMNSFLTELDISGNQMGDNGANVLGKALQINNRLTTIVWDGNNTTAVGFGYIASALLKNFTLKRMPTPVIDVTAALRGNQEKVLQALKKIDGLLLRNQNPKTYSTEINYRLQQSFLTGTSQLVLDKLVSQIQDVVRYLRRIELNDGEKEEIDGATKLIKEKQLVSSVFMELHRLSTGLKSPEGPFFARLESFQKEVHSLMGKQIQNSFEDALKSMVAIFPCTLKKQPFPSELRASCSEQCSPPDGILRELIIDRMGAEMMSKALEIQLNVFTQIITFVVEELLKALNAKLTSLTQICSQRQTEVTKTPSVMSRANAVSKETKNKIGTVRQSMQTRMLRPKSTMLEGPDVLDIFPDEVFEDGYPSSLSSRPTPDGVHGTSSESFSTNSLKTDSKTSSLAADDISDLPVSPPLANLRWNRPKREKNYASTSPEGTYKSIDNCEESDDDDDKDSVNSGGSGSGNQGQPRLQQQNGHEETKNNGCKESETPKFKAVKPNVLPVKPVPVSPGKTDRGRKTIHPPRLGAAKRSPLGTPTGNSTDASAVATETGSSSPLEKRKLKRTYIADKPYNSSDTEEKSDHTAKDSDSSAKTEDLTTSPQPDSTDAVSKEK